MSSRINIPPLENFGGCFDAGYGIITPISQSNERPVWEVKGLNGLVVERRRFTCDVERTQKGAPGSCEIQGNNSVYDEFNPN
jgi:hypothetical protein